MFTTVLPMRLLLKKIIFETGINGKAPAKTGKPSDHSSTRKLNQIPAVGASVALDPNSQHV